MTDHCPSCQEVLPKDWAKENYKTKFKCRCGSVLGLTLSRFWVAALFAACLAIIMPFTEGLGLPRIQEMLLSVSILIPASMAIFHFARKPKKIKESV